MSEKPHAGHGDDHGHHGNPFVQHHYDDAQHQFDSGKLGIWLFLAQEVLFFSALFVAYILYRHHHGEIYAYAHKYLDVKMGAINTAVLIFSSLTAAWAVRAAQLKQKKMLVTCLALTIACALGFLVIKYFEYTHKIHEHIMFGKRFDPCVSSGGTPLATKNNECPGSKSTVDWDYAKAAPNGGCFANIALDQDPRTPLVQADCKVYEAHASLKLGADKKTEELVFAGPKKEITNLCHDPVYGPDGGLPPNTKPAFPCWKPSRQPHVCKGGWFYAWQCQGEKCATPHGGEGPFPSLQACKDSRRGKEGAIAGQGTAYVTDCTHGSASAIVVEYNDHHVRPSPELNTDGTVIQVECKGSPVLAAKADPLADTEQKLELGKRTTLSRPPLTHADEKAAMYAGPPPEHTNMFFTIYFAMTGLHGIHVLFGVFVFVWLLIRAIKGHFTPDYFGPIDFAALYWHIVDLIWIFLFPLLYLIH